MKRSRRTLRIGACILSCSLVAACGAPDLGHMKPNVWKPTAAILLVDNPPHWVNSDVESVATAQGVVANVLSVSSAQLATTLANLTSDAGLNLIVCVQNVPIPQTEYDTANQNAGKRFELIGTESSVDSPMNVKQIVPDPDATGYALGWLAGQLSMTMGSQNVGWVTDGVSNVSKDVVQACLEGAYSANASFSVLPIAAASLDATTVAQVPHILVTPSPLSDAQLQVFSSAGIVVISLSNQSAPAISARSSLPDETVLNDDLAALAHSAWKSGATKVVQSNMVWMNPSVVPTDVVTNVADVLSGLQGTPPSVSTAWGRIPDATRQKWNVIPGLSG